MTLQRLGAGDKAAWTSSIPSGYGTIYVDDADGHVYFKNDIGTTWDLTSSAASAAAAYRDYIDQSGTPASPAAGHHLAFVDSNGVLNLLDSSGNVVPLATVADVVSLAARGPGMWFDGSSAYSNLPQDIGTDDFTIIAGIYIPTISSLHEILHEGAIDVGSEGFKLYLNSASQLAFRSQKPGYTYEIAFSGAVPSRPFVAVFGRNGDNGFIGINGLIETSNGATALLGSTNYANYNTGIRLGRAGWTSFTYFENVYYFILRFNLALTQSEIQQIMLSGVPEKYLGASQQELVTNGGFETYTGTQDDGVADTFSGWAVTGGVVDATATVNSGVNAVKLVGSSATIDSSSIAVIPGKKYRLTVYSRGDGTNPPYLRLMDGAYAALPGYSGLALNSSTSYVKSEHIFEGPANGHVIIRFYQNSATGVSYVDDVSLVQIGCVAQYEPDGISHNQWLDKSGNGLHGANSGATPINLPSTHEEMFIQEFSADGTFTCPAGYQIDSIAWKGVSGSPTINIGTTAGGTDIVNGGVTSATGEGTFTIAGQPASLEADKTVYVSSASWGTVKLYVRMRRVNIA